LYTNSVISYTLWAFTTLFYYDNSLILKKNSLIFKKKFFVGITLMHLHSDFRRSCWC